MIYKKGILFGLTTARSDFTWTNVYREFHIQIYGDSRIKFESRPESVF